MFLGALVDLGADRGKLSAALRYIEESVLGCRNLRLEFEQHVRGGIQGQGVKLKAEEKSEEMTGAELEEAVSRVSEELALSSKAKKLAQNAIRTLIKAEAKIHGEAPERVHLEELGSVDTIVDIIGTAMALEDLKLLEGTQTFSTPVGVGSGLLKLSHGSVPAPPPATLEILRERQFPLVGCSVRHELATPTGVSLLVNLADEVISCYPSMRPVQIGYGTGEADFSGTPNLLRLVLGESTEDYLLAEKIYMLETNVDDVPGEVVGYVMDRALREGAKDFCLIPMFTKKDRPGQIIQIMAESEKAGKLAQMLFEELGTLGVRFYPCQRYILERESIPMEIMVAGEKEKVKVKIARDERGKLAGLKPEYEEVKRVAEKSGKSFREIFMLIQKAASEKLSAD